MTHQHEWRVMDLCRDYCAGCPRLRRACPPRHDHTARVPDGRRPLYGKDYWRAARSDRQTTIAQIVALHLSRHPKSRPGCETCRRIKEGRWPS